MYALPLTCCVLRRVMKNVREEIFLSPDRNHVYFFLVPIVRLVKRVSSAFSLYK